MSGPSSLSRPDSPVDLTELERLGDEKDGHPAHGFVEEVIELFLHLSPQLYKTARDAFEDADAQSVARAAHKLKSQAAYFGAERLVEVCRMIEQHGYGGQLSRCERLLDDLEDELDRVTAALQARRQKAG